MNPPSHATPAAPTRKLPAHLLRLDVLRAAAILLVFCHHFAGERCAAFPAPWKGLGRDYSAWPHHGLEFLLLLPFTCAWAGVALFFVLSGFCIHYAYLKKPAAFTITNFYWRRFVRIYPAYLAALLAFVLLRRIGVHLIPSAPTGSVLAHLFLVHNFASSTVLGINSDFWSLAIEFQFYFLYPLIVFTQKRIPLERWLVVALVLSVLCQLLDGATAFLSRENEGLAHFFQATSLVPTNLARGALPIDSILWCNPFSTWCDWLLGACLAQSFATSTKVFRRPLFFVLISAALFVVSDNFKFLHWQSYLFASVFFAIVMETYLHLDWRVHIIERLLVPVGVVSYSFYLWHDPLLAEVLHLFRVVLPHPPAFVVALELPAALALILPVAALSWYIFERGISGNLRKKSPGSGTIPASEIVQTVPS